MPKPIPSAADLQKLQTDALETTSAAAAKTMEGFRKLAQLNIETARASLEQSSEQINALLSVRDTQTLAELVTSFAKLSPDKFTAYANAVYAISRETGTDIGALVEKQVAQSNEQISAAIAALAQNAPSGSGAAVDFITQSIEAAKDAYAQMQSAAEDFATMGAAASPGTKTAGKARKR